MILMCCAKRTRQTATPSTTGDGSMGYNPYSAYSLGGSYGSQEDGSSQHAEIPTEAVHDIYRSHDNENTFFKKRTWGVDDEPQIFGHTIGKLNVDDPNFLLANQMLKDEGKDRFTESNWPDPLDFEFVKKRSKDGDKSNVLNLGGFKQMLLGEMMAELL